MYRCIRCEDEFTHAELTLRCPRAPDLGPHETLDVRRGFSLHELSCPRSGLSPLVSASCKCQRTGASCKPIS